MPGRMEEGVIILWNKLLQVAEASAMGFLRITPNCSKNESTNMLGFTRLVSDINQLSDMTKSIGILLVMSDSCPKLLRVDSRLLRGL